jgi:hypothetical protein
MSEHVEPATDRAKRGMLAGSTGLEPAASGVTGRRSNQLNYDPELLVHFSTFLLWYWAVQDSNL